MTRNLDPAIESASAAEAIHPVLFIDLAFDSGHVRFHSELGTLSFGGNDYTGTGRLGSVGTVEEETELARTPLALTLSGIPNDLVSVILNEHYQGRQATVSLGYLDASRQLVADPCVIYRGLMDTPTIDQGEQLTVTLTVESRFSKWDTPLVRRYNNADQQSRYPGDKGLEFVEQSTDRQIAWGTKLQ